MNTSATKIEVRDFGRTLLTKGVAASFLWLFLLRLLTQHWHWIFFLSLLGVALLVGSLSFFWPVRFVFLHQFWKVLLRVIDFVVSHVSLTLLYYLVITPIGLMGRWFRWTSFRKNMRPEVSSYWQKHKSTESLERYFRQF